MKKFFFNLSVILIVLAGQNAWAASGPDYPRLANYYLKPHISEADYPNLANFDLLVLDVDCPAIDPDLGKDLKQKNSDIIILAYVPSQSVNVADLSDWAEWRRATYQKAEENDWWLYDAQGNYVSFSSTWPTIRFVDVGEGWSRYLADMVAEKMEANPEWDGVFYDMVFANLSWLNNGNLDIDEDGRPDRTEEVNAYWRAHMRELLENTRQKIGDKLVLANIDMVDHYQHETNGVMMENFPAKWLGEDGWAILIDKYLHNLPNENDEPRIYIINANTDNNKVADKYKEMRFGLASTLLGEGYFSFDEGDENHAQTWWFDEYDVNLGQALSGAYNVKDKNSDEIRAGLWRRDFEYGVALVNSSKQDQLYVSQTEEFEKINGNQDRSVNDGRRVNWVKLAAGDGVILLKTNTDIVDNSFRNGSFVRVFDQAGGQVRNGFFAYIDRFDGNSHIMLTDLDNDGDLETIVNGGGQIDVYDNSKLHASFFPYGPDWRGEVSFAAADLDGDKIKEIITGAGAGGGPHVRVFSKDGRPLIGGFMAYDSAFRGGVNVAAMDLDNDGELEIITGAGAGGGPHVRVFSKDGRPLIGGFMAYDSAFRGGVNIAAGDTDGDGELEIITGAGAGGGPHVRVFSKDGRLNSEFMAYEQETGSGVEVMALDIDGNKIDEILVSTISF